MAELLLLKQARLSLWQSTAESCCYSQSWRSLFFDRLLMYENNLLKIEHHISVSNIVPILQGWSEHLPGHSFLMFSQGVLALVLPLKVESLGFDTKTTGLLLSTFGVVAILIFLLPINRIFDRVRPIVTLAFGMSLMGLSMLFLSQVEELNYLYIAMVFTG